MRTPLSKELWFRDDPTNVDDFRFKDWSGRERE